MTPASVLSTSKLNSNFRVKFGPWIDALPEISTLASKLPFKQQGKLGERYRVPFTAGIEHGHTASRAGGLFTLRPAIGAESGFAELDGSTIIMRTQYAWDEIYASLGDSDMEATSNSRSYQDVMSLKMKAKGLGGSLYRDLALAYGPGAGAAVSANIGVIKTTAAGDLSTTRDVFLTKASWIRGLWPTMRNALVDVYQANGTTIRSTNVQIYGVPNQNKTLVRFGPSTIADAPTGTPAAILTATDVIVPAGWKGNSCIGLESIMKTQTGSLWEVNVDEIAQMRTLQFDAANGPLTRKLIREWGALIADNKSKMGGDLLVDGSAFASLAEEYSTSFQRDTNNDGGVKKSGESALVFATPAGEIKVEVWDLAKQGQAMYLAKSSRAYRVGTTDNTMRPIKGLNEGFLTPLIDKSGCQSMMFSNQAPFCDQNWHNFIVTNIVSSGNVAES